MASWDTVARMTARRAAAEDGFGVPLKPRGRRRRQRCSQAAKPVGPPSPVGQPARRTAQRVCRSAAVNMEQRRRCSTQNRPRRQPRRQDGRVGCPLSAPQAWVAVAGDASPAALRPRPDPEGRGRQAQPLRAQASNTDATGAGSRIHTCAQPRRSRFGVRLSHAQRLAGWALARGHGSRLENCTCHCKQEQDTARSHPSHGSKWVGPWAGQQWFPLAPPAWERRRRWKRSRRLRGRQYLSCRILPKPPTPGWAPEAMQMQMRLRYDGCESSRTPTTSPALA